MMKLKDELNVARAALWDCFVLAGGDTDGNSAWHCSTEDAARAAVDAVRQLREDYEEEE
jgi:hypothetical protein